MTRIEIINAALSFMDSETADTSDDTVEASQVAMFFNIAYKQFLAEYAWPWLEVSETLELVDDNNNQMRLPDLIEEVLYIKYNGNKLRYVSYETMEDYLDANINGGVESADTNGALTTQDPTMWTIDGDRTIVFNSYDEALQSSLTRVRGIRSVSDIIDDDAETLIPDRYINVIAYLLAAVCLLTLKGDDSLGTMFMRMYLKELVRAKSNPIRVKGVSHRVDSKINYGRLVGLTSGYYKWK